MCAPRKSNCESPLVQVAVLIVFAVLTVASGYPALYLSGGAIWDVAFIASAAGLLLVFVRFMMTLAAATMHSGLEPSKGAGESASETGPVDPPKVLPK